jgi:hypothetical protein
LFAGVTALSRLHREAQADPKERSRPNWLIALTDGQDNSSSATHAQVNRHLQQHPTHLIIITVGQSYDRAEVESVIATAKSTKKQGFHIQAGVDDIALAFQNVAKLITTQLNVEAL